MRLSKLKLVAKNEEVQYGGFWRRLGALIVDIVVFVPLSALTFWLSIRFLFSPLYYLPVNFLIGMFYEVYLVKRYGGTLGKVVMGLRIVKTDFSPVGYRAAILRYLPSGLLGIALAVASILVVLTVNPDDFYALSLSLKRTAYVATFKPNWNQWVNIAYQVWIWGELFVLLTNAKKRAVHDFIAGTVVIVRSKK